MGNQTDTDRHRVMGNYPHSSTQGHGEPGDRYRGRTNPSGIDVLAHASPELVGTKAAWAVLM